MEELETVYVIETLEDLYVVEDEVFEGKVLDGVLELATQFNSRREANDFLAEMSEAGISGKIKEAKIFIKVMK
ncbi:hypothetical protein M9R32_13950 [Paenisporosarcina quisquiliarum]|uniref:Uncharacterized protein n=1 Tax=Paenisporosarcina quisquiliarum TaxID=365346 RepID=A0A9X3LHV0_9BACL|nr:hypothetical protein [Paenisporosarcina quisquiliarum]MCZ8538295.1 hypothetical protein [Paenisporosarcina quisquiliarum]